MVLLKCESTNYDTLLLPRVLAVPEPAPSVNAHVRTLFQGPLCALSRKKACMSVVTPALRALSRGSEPGS